MRQIRHPLVARDVDGNFDPVLAVTGGELDAAERRLDAIDASLAAIAANPASGVRLSGRLSGWLARHGGRGQRITIVFRPEGREAVLLVALVAFGGRDWLGAAEERRDFAGR